MQQVAIRYGWPLIAVLATPWLAHAQAGIEVVDGGSLTILSGGAIESDLDVEVAGASTAELVLSGTGELRLGSGASLTIGDGSVSRETWRSRSGR